LWSASIVLEDFHGEDPEDLEVALSDVCLDLDGFVAAPDVLVGGEVKHGDVWL
jgi:hypothetical protein